MVEHQIEGYWISYLKPRISNKTQYFSDILRQLKTKNFPVAYLPLKIRKEFL